MLLLHKELFFNSTYVLKLGCFFDSVSLLIIAFVQFEANTIYRKSVLSEKIAICEVIRRKTRKMLWNAKAKMAGT